MILSLPCVILWAQPCFLLERVRKIDRGSNVDQEQVRKVSPVWFMSTSSISFLYIVH